MRRSAPERGGLAAAMGVWERIRARLGSDKSATQAAPVKVGGRGVLLEPLRGKMSKLPGRGWPRRLPDGRFQHAS
ncbi:hypothetical protein LRD69_25455 [Streptomyces sp. JH14]|uniref:hypothetical protein n=1 Tax=Streptomyces sp. JH14 TaxID=2793630 RepID=UPI0023F95E62|nr:hypothetical protein [Streptomyces sp. JH14]MDF6045433.1 hypothetical protein [Streptomyces sp. JH14]